MMHAFLLIGQSNMAGRGFLDEAIPVDTEHIFTLRGGRWQPMFRPINPDRPFSGVSLGERFAECYAQANNVDVGLVCCADGGTTLEQWQPGGVLYDHAVSQARLAMRSAEIKAVLWHQGESDCRRDLAESYEQRFLPIVRSLRRDLGLERVPFLVGGLGDYLAACTLESEDVEHYPLVNAGLRRVAECEPMMAYVSAEGLTSNSDYLHFNAASLYRFGERYFEALNAIVQKA